jgi:hypothetical protein
MFRESEKNLKTTRVSPLLQVSHAQGGQYKYSGHTISFPQNINTIVN